jgi:hypothetical protein
MFAGQIGYKGNGLAVLNPIIEYRVGHPNILLFFVVLLLSNLRLTITAPLSETLLPILQYYIIFVGTLVIQ